MSSITFASGTIVPASWLNDVNSVTYKAAGGLSGAVVNRTALVRNADYVHIKDYGAVCDGVADDTTAIQTCVAANPNRTILVSGTPLISATIILDGKQHLMGEGGINAASSQLPATYFKKKSTMTSVGVIIGMNAIMSNIGVYCPNGSTNGGVQLRGNTSSGRFVVVVGDGPAVGATGVGFRVGDNVGTNTNSWELFRCNASGLTGHSFWVHDGSGAAPNCNAGKATECEGLVCGGSGFVIDNATLNTLDTCLGEANVGWGLDIGSGTGILAGQGNSVIGGDYEGNTAGQVRLGIGASRTRLNFDAGMTVVDTSFFSQRFDRYNSKYVDFTPSLWGSTGATKTGTAVTVVGSVATWTSVAHGYANGQTVVVGLTVGAPNANLMGAFVISNVTANTFDVTVRTDQSALAPVSASGLTISLQACGTYSAQYGRYRMNNSSIDFDFTLVSTSITNLTGVIGIVVPWDAAIISGGVGPTTLQATIDLGYYSGITHTGKLALPIVQDGGRIKFIQKNIGSGLVPAQLAAADIAAATTIITSGASYQWIKET